MNLMKKVKKSGFVIHMDQIMYRRLTKDWFYKAPSFAGKSHRIKYTDNESAAGQHKS
jgi:hypothetical protein